MTKLLISRRGRRYVSHWNHTCKYTKNFHFDRKTIHLISTNTFLQNLRGIYIMWDWLAYNFEVILLFFLSYFFLSFFFITKSHCLSIRDEIGSVDCNQAAEQLYLQPVLGWLINRRHKLLSCRSRNLYFGSLVCLFVCLFVYSYSLISFWE